jgi:hypothetical protein
MFMDFSNVEGKSVKKVGRAELIAALTEWLTEKFGEVYVTQTGTSDFAVAIGEKGNEVCAEFSITMKDFVDRTTPKKGLVKAFDRKAAGDKYKADREKAAANKAARKATADKNKARDEAKREADKAKAKAKEESEG